MRESGMKRYKIIKSLGQGGEGTVYQVMDKLLKKEWAMKEFPKVSSVAGMHNKEAEVLTQIDHPSFPRIVDIFFEKENGYLVMDYIKGITLEDIIEQESISEQTALEWGIRIADAILYLHQFHPVLLYLDLKPSNIIVDESGQIKIIDMGSVLVKGEAAYVGGTYGYASPEQISLSRNTKELDERSDIFSLGMVLFVMLRGTCKHLPLVDGKSKKGLLVRKYNPCISAGTEKIIERATRGRKEARYGGIREMKEALLRQLQRVRKKKKILFKIERSTCEYVRGYFWQQEKSILCVGGEFLFYHGKGLLLFAAVILYSIAVFPAHAKEANGIEVIIRDSELRKVLVREESPYESQENLLLEIPWSNFMSDSFEVTILCKEQGTVIGEYSLDCFRK